MYYLYLFILLEPCTITNSECSANVPVANDDVLSCADDSFITSFHQENDTRKFYECI